MVYGADPVTATDIRRFLEPLEFDCPLHYDRDAATRGGVADVTLPYDRHVVVDPAHVVAGRPASELFDDDARDAHPARSPINNPDQDPAPRRPVSLPPGWEMDFVRRSTVGERIGARARKLLACVPKETSVGRG